MILPVRVSLYVHAQCAVQPHKVAAHALGSQARAYLVTAVLIVHANQIRLVAQTAEHNRDVYRLARRVGNRALHAVKPTVGKAVQLNRLIQCRIHTYATYHKSTSFSRLHRRVLYFQS